MRRYALYRVPILVKIGLFSLTLATGFTYVSSEASGTHQHTYIYINIYAHTHTHLMHVTRTLTERDAYAQTSNDSPCPLVLMKRRSVSGS